MALLPRRCPLCQADTIIGHGRRLRQSHDQRREALWVRRGFCQPCRKTFTILPDWVSPFGRYTVQCRQESCERITRKLRRSAKIRHACPIHRPCADGCIGGFSPCGAGCGPELKASICCGRPPSSPGIWSPSAVFCRSRQGVRESSGSRRIKAAGSAAGLSSGSRLATGPAAQPGSANGAMSSALRSQTKLPGGPR